MTNEIQNLKNRIAKMISDGVENMDTDELRRFTDNFRYFNDMLKETNEDMHCATHLLESKDLNQREFTLISVFGYLLSAEGYVCNVINLISYLLVIAGHDLYSFTRRKYLKDKIEEIGKVEMSTKIQFLKHHGFGALTKEYDSTLRNDIAHHNYKIDRKGVLWVRGKAVDMSSEIKPFLWITSFAGESLTRAYESLEELLNQKSM